MIVKFLEKDVMDFSPNYNVMVDGKEGIIYCTEINYTHSKEIVLTVGETEILKGSLYIKSIFIEKEEIIRWLLENNYQVDIGEQNIFNLDNYIEWIGSYFSFTKYSGQDYHLLLFFLPHNKFVYIENSKSKVFKIADFNINEIIFANDRIPYRRCVLMERSDEYGGSMFGVYYFHAFINDGAIIEDYNGNCRKWIGDYIKFLEFPK